MIANPNDGNSPRVEVATPMIDVSAGGLITATTEQEKGYVPGGTKSATQQLTTQGAATITPGTTNQTAVPAGVYTTGAVQVAGDANLKAENIAEGVSIFGVLGTLSGGGGDREQILITVNGTPFIPITYIVVSNGSVLKNTVKANTVITADINSIMLFAAMADTPIVTAISNGDVTNIVSLSDKSSSYNYAVAMANCDIEVTR